MIGLRQIECAAAIGRALDVVGADITEAGDGHAVAGYYIGSKHLSITLGFNGTALDLALSESEDGKIARLLTAAEGAALVTAIGLLLDLTDDPGAPSEIREALVGLTSLAGGASTGDPALDSDLRSRAQDVAIHTFETEAGQT